MPKFRWHHSNHLPNKFLPQNKIFQLDPTSVNHASHRSDLPFNFKDTNKNTSVLSVLLPYPIFFKVSLSPFHSPPN
ncbi:hypothetical protein HKD37_17G049009 [Glycine soja]|nr:hypothetical protein GmHk_17G050090 [Glycine max]